MMSRETMSRGDRLARQLLEAVDYEEEHETTADELQREINNLQFGVNEIKDGYSNMGRDDMLNAIDKLLELLSAENEMLVVRRQL